MEQNTQMIKAVCGHRVLIKREKIEEVSEGGIVIHASEKEKRREEAGICVGEIVAVGETAWYDYTHKFGEKVGEKWADVGDRVLFTKYGGRHVELPGEKKEDDYVVVNDGDVLAILEK